MKVLASLLAVALACGAAETSAQSNLLASADPSGARAAVERLVSLNAASGINTSEARALLTGELADSSFRTWRDLRNPDTVLMLSDGTAVARMPAQSNELPDIYLYLRRNEAGDWKVEALRALFMSAICVRGGSEARESNAARTGVNPVEEHCSFLTSDADYRQWFERHRAQFDRFRTLRPTPATSAEMSRLFRELNVRSIGWPDPSLTEIVLGGGQLLTSLRLLHSTDPAAVPPISRDEYIWIESLGGGWYLSKQQDL